MIISELICEARIVGLDYCAMRIVDTIGSDMDCKRRDALVELAYSDTLRNVLVLCALLEIPFQDRVIRLFV